MTIQYTANFSLPYPQSSDTPNVPRDIQALATAVDGLSIALKTGNLSQFASTTSAQLIGVISDETGSGSLVFSNSPTLVTPILGTPTSVTLTNGTGLPINTGVSGLGAGIATFLATPSSANLLSALTDKTGTGSNVFATSPTLVTPNIGVATATTINGLTLTSSAAGFTIAGGTTSKTLTLSNTLTLAGTDTSTLNIGTGGTLGSAAFTASTAYLSSSVTSLPLVTLINGTTIPASSTLLTTVSTTSGLTSFGTSPTLSGTLTISGATFNTGGVTYFYQPAITTISTSGANTLTIAQLLTEILNYTGTNTATFTLPTGTLMDGGVTGIVNNVAFDWSIVNTVAFAITMAPGTSHTYVGNTTVAANISARFRSVRTGTTTWVTYRLS